MYELESLVGLTMALIIGVLVYRDASIRGLTHRTIWSLSIGILSGIAGFLSIYFAYGTYIAIQATSYPAITEYPTVIEQPVIVTPFEILLTGLVVGLVISLSIVSVYRINTSSVPAQ